MLCGQVAGRLLILLDIANVSPVVGVNLAVLAVLTPWATYAVALLSFHILDPLPAARQTALAQMREGMIVLDARQRIASVNPAAATMLNIVASRAQGRLLPDLLPDLLLPASAGSSAPRAAAPAQYAGEPLEITWRGAAGEHWYAVERSQLSDFRGQLVGHLLMLRDVTEQKRSHAQFLEQERALATLRERERLARELHDGVAQQLAAAHLQVSTAKLLSAHGQVGQLQVCLDDLADTTLQAEADLRAYLLGVKTTTAAARPLFSTLREYLVQFTRVCGIPAHLTAPAELEEEGLPPAVEVQLVRIIQEALTNVRKHAYVRPNDPDGRDGRDTHEAPSVQVIFSLCGAQVHIVIADNGCGFNPAPEARAGSGYGLRAMEERAQAVGGSLCVTATPGQGAKVTVTVPRLHTGAATAAPIYSSGAQEPGASNGDGVTR